MFDRKATDKALGQDTADLSPWERFERQKGRVLAVDKASEDKTEKAASAER